MLKAQDQQKLTPLHLACSYGQTEIVKVLLEHGANIKGFGEQHQVIILLKIHYRKTSSKYLGKSKCTTSNYLPIYCWDDHRQLYTKQRLLATLT